MGKKKKTQKTQKPGGNHGEFPDESALLNGFSPAVSMRECTGLIPSGTADSAERFINAKSLQSLENQFVNDNS